MTTRQQLPILAASICVRRGPEVLLIQRGKEPGLGKWAFPGGQVIFGETTRQAALRELKEEASIEADLGDMIGLYEVIYPAFHFAIACYVGFNPTGILRAASDAADARWVNVDFISQLPLAANIAATVAASEHLMRA